MMEVYVLPLPLPAAMASHLSKLQFLAMALATVLSAAAPVSVEAQQRAMSDVEAGQAYLAAGRGAEAAAFFERAIKRDPANATLHYYMANALVKAKAHERALKEYQVAYMLEPRGGVSAYCLQALTAYQARVPNLLEADDFQKRMRDTSGGALSAYTGMDAGAGSVGANPDAERAASLMSRQLADEKLKAAVRAEASKKNADVRMQAKLKKIEQDTADALARASEPQISWGMVNRHMGQIVLYPSPDEIKRREAEIRAKAQDLRDEALRSGQEQQSSYDAQLKKQEESMNEVANNLASQMSANSKNGVQIHARGTNLYVRQYVPFVNKTSAKAHSSIARITSSGGGIAKPGGEETGRSGRKVEGRVLDSPQK